MVAGSVQNCLFVVGGVGVFVLQRQELGFLVLFLSGLVASPAVLDVVEAVDGGVLLQGDCVAEGLFASGLVSGVHLNLNW